MKLDLTDREAEAVKGALKHVWREVYDKEVDGEGGALLSVLAKLDPTYKSLIPCTVRRTR